MYNYYVVQRGDTLYSIANMFNTTVYQLRLINNFLNNKVLEIGEVLLVPTNNISSNQNMSNMIPNNNENLFDNYVVEKGDSIYSISSKYDVSSNVLMYLNGLNNSFLRPGQVLIVPKRQVSVFITRE
ncbi:MAG: LysM peptidoglycan-binding domain-containing protein [Bacilli bacterium]|nr:LysM peptidoglycan-binding domain-containing protein [Bacilli bacterium]